MTHNNPVLTQEQKINNLKKIITQVISDYHLPLNSEEIRTWRNSKNKELVKWIEKTRLIKEFEIEVKDFGEQVPNWYEDLVQELESGEKSGVIKDIIKYWKGRTEELKKELEIEELKAETHLEAVKVCEDWYFTHHINPLNKKVADKSELLETSNGIIKTQRERIQELEKDLEEKSELLKESNKIIKEQKTQSYLDSKPLPKIPSKFKLLKKSAKVKFKQLQNVIKKTKVQTQEFIARIEVKVK